MASITGQTISHYRVLEEIGGGGMGVVYKAEDLKLGRPVALKFICEDLALDSVAREQFRREARAVSTLHHPGILTIYDIGEDQGRTYLVMEFLEGMTLKKRLEAGPLDVDATIALGTEMADALEAAHAEGVLHGDIKPANIFVTSRGHIRILDFGLAKLTGTEARDSALTMTPSREAAAATPWGTIPYMSPEQARGRTLDMRTDLFSFGIVLYEVATGRQPFRGPTVAAVLNAILHRTALPPSRLNPDIPAKLEEVMTKCLEKNLELRYQRASDIAADLRRLKRDADLIDLVTPVDDGGAPNATDRTTRLS